MSYSYQEFTENVLCGREVEFAVRGVNYSITHVPEGFCFSRFYGDYVIFSTAEELLARVKIEGKTFKELFEQGLFVLNVLY